MARFVTKPATGRHRSEIEITPEMIEAGRRELVSFDSRVTDTDEAAERIVRAALECGGYSVFS